MFARIGITTSYDGEKQQLRHAYVRAVEHAGGAPFIVPMMESDAVFCTLFETLDALIVTGGPAITTGLVGTLPDDISSTAPLRRETDRRLLEAFLDAGKPVLGICYGMQLINALAGGTIYADVQRQLDGATAHSQKRAATDHPVQILANTCLHEVLGVSKLTVNTRHVQALATVGEGLKVAARAPDGVIEAIENEDGSVLGVQFHPERMENVMQPLFQYLVHQADNRTEARVRFLA